MLSIVMLKNVIAERFCYNVFLHYYRVAIIPMINSPILKSEKSYFRSLEINRPAFRRVQDASMAFTNFPSPSRNR